MPARNNDRVQKLIDEDPRIATGHVYLSPQTIQHDDGSYDPIFNAGERHTSTTTKSPSYKAKLIFEGSTRSIGEFKKEGTRVTCRIHMDERERWYSSIHIDIKAWKIKRPPFLGLNREDELVHVWTIRLNAASCHSDEPTVYMYPKLEDHPTSKASESEPDKHFHQYYHNFCEQDAGARDARNKEHLGWLQIDFVPSKVHTEGILLERPDLGKFQPIHDELDRLFRQPSDNPIRLGAFFTSTEPDSFYSAYVGIREAFEQEIEFPPHAAFFGNLADAKCKVQKGQVTDRENRPELRVPFVRSFPTSELLWTTEGMSVIYEAENEFEDTKQAKLCDCQLRVLKVTPGGDRVYIGLVRLPSQFPYRFSAEDSFLISLQNENWTATILPKPYPFASSVDYTVSLNRPYDAETDSYSGLELPSVFDLTSTNNETTVAAVGAYCFNGKPIQVQVIPVLSDIPSKYRLAAIRKLNPAHVEDRRHTPNTRWQRIILGQDLRTMTNGDLFGGMDLEAKLREWRIELSVSQMTALNYLAHVPNNLGLVKGPWGTGKTKFDIVVTMLLMSIDKKVKVLSPTNMAADTFTVGLISELDRLHGLGIEITKKHVVRFHSPTTEADVIQAEQRRDAPRDDSKSRWQPVSAIPSSMFDSLAMEIVDSSRVRVAGIPDRRYKLHEASFGTLLLGEAGLLHQSESEQSTHTPLAEIPTTLDDGHPPEASDLTEDIANEDHPPEASDLIEDIANEDHADNDDLDNEIDPEDECNDGAVFHRPESKADEDSQQRVRRETQEKLASAAGKTQREKIICCFRESFAQAKEEPLEGDRLAIYRSMEKELSIYLLQNDISCVVTTLVNSGHSLIKENFKGNHTILQEAGKTENGDAYIALAESEESIHLSGDEMQLPPPEKDPARNPFAEQTNRSLFRRWLNSGYPACELLEQHRSIPEITKIISEIWYGSRLLSTVDTAERPNAAKAMQVHKEIFGCKTHVVWVNTDGRSSKMGFSQSSQNKRELQVAIKLCKEYVKRGIMADDIVVLAGYMAQANLTKRALAVTTGLHEVDSGTIDGYQGGEKAITVLCMVGSEKLGFMALGARQLTGVSRAADGLAIITNSTGIETGEHQRKRQTYDLLQSKIKSNRGFTTYQDDLPALDLTVHDSDMSLDDGDDTNAEDPEAAPNTTTADSNNALSWGDGFDTNAEDQEAAPDTPTADIKHVLSGFTQDINADDPKSAPDSPTPDTSNALPTATQDVNTEEPEAAANTAHPDANNAVPAATQGTSGQHWLSLTQAPSNVTR